MNSRLDLVRLQSLAFVRAPGLALVALQWIALHGLALFGLQSLPLRGLALVGLQSLALIRAPGLALVGLKSLALEVKWNSWQMNRFCEIFDKRSKEFQSGRNKELKIQKNFLYHNFQFM